MTKFRTAADIKQFADSLVTFLRNNIKDTHGRDEWSRQNFEILGQFVEMHGAEGYPTSKGTPESERRVQFLWDFIGYVSEEGLLLVAESEFDKPLSGLQHDFEKLLYVRSPVKIMIVRVRNPNEAESICTSLREFMGTTCSEFSPAEVFVIYCVWWASPEGVNQDIAYMLQVKGEPAHCSIPTDQPFIPV